MKRNDISLDELVVREVSEDDLHNDPPIEGPRHTFSWQADDVAAPWDDIPDDDSLTERHRWRPQDEASTGDAAGVAHWRREAAIEEEMGRRREWDEKYGVPDRAGNAVGEEADSNETPSGGEPEEATVERQEISGGGHGAEQPAKGDSGRPGRNSVGTRENVKAGDAGGEDATDGVASKSPGKPSRMLSYVQSMVSGEVLEKSRVKKMYPFMLYLAFLAVVYIANGYKMQSLNRYHNNLLKEVHELRTKSLTLSSKRVNATRRTTIVQEVEQRGLGLKEPFEPPMVIDK